MENPNTQTASDYYLEGNELFHAADYMAAIKKYKKAVEVDPEFEAAYTQWGQAAIKLKDPDPELKACRIAVETDLNTPNGYNDLGNRFYELERYKEAISNYKTALKLKPNHSHAFHNWGLCLAAQGEYEQAIEKYRQTLNIDPNFISAYHNWGLALAKQGKYSLAIGKYKKAIAIDHAYEAAYTNWGNAIPKLKSPNKELKAYRKAVEANLDSSDAYNGLGITYYDLKYYQQANRYYEKALNKQPDHKEAYHNWGLSLAAQGQYEEAVDKYRKAIEIDPDYEPSLNYWGRALFEQGDYSRAVEKFRKIIEINPEYDTAYTNWGEAIKQLDDPKDEFKAFREATEKNRNTADGYNELGNIYYEQDNFKEAIVCYRKALEKQADHKYAIHNWGLCLTGEGRYEESIEKYRQVLAIDSNFEDSWQSWGFSLLYLNHYRGALEKFKKTLELNPANTYAAHNYAYVLERMGQYKQSKEKWEQAGKLYQQTGEAARKNSNAQHFYYAGSINLYSLQNFDEAEKQYEKGLEIEPENSAIHTDLIHLYLLQKNKIIKNNQKSLREKAKLHWKAMELFNRAESILKKRLEEQENLDTLNNLGTLYRIMGNHKTAKTYFEKTLQAGKDDDDIYSELGVVASELENYGDAVTYFKKAIDNDPGSFLHQTNLGEAHLKAGSKNEAESIFQNVYEVCPCYVDSLIGLAEVYSAMGDDAGKSNQTGDTVDMYARALDYYSELLKLNFKNPEHASKKLNVAELSSIFYSCGYLRVRLYEGQNHKDFELLEKALDDFKGVAKNSPNYYKSLRAIRKINNRLNPPQTLSSKWGSGLVFACAVIVFIVAQLGFFIGTPAINWTSYKIDAETLKSYVSEPDADSSYINLANLIGMEFASKDEYVAELNRELGSNATAKLAGIDMMRADRGVQISGFNKIESGYYALLTFGALIFMVAGLYLKETSRLKFGAIELEKSTVEQISTKQSFGIKK